MAKYKNGLEDCLDIPDNSVRVLESRYLARDSNGEIFETGEDLFRRVAKDIASADALYLDSEKRATYETPRDQLYEIAGREDSIVKRENDFFEIMKNGYFLPNSPTLMNAGRGLQQLSACFVLPIDDSMEDIFETQKNMAMVHKSGGGTGFSFSRLRPNGAYIHSTEGHSPGPLSFLFGYNENAGQITQGGKRRGANMGVLEASHPDALCWSKVKREEGALSNFNLSLAFTDDQIDAVKNDGYILMEDPRPGKEYTIDNARNRMKEIIYGKGDRFRTSWELSEDEKSIVDTESGNNIGKVEDDRLYFNAKALYNAVIEGNWMKGEPGMLFIDKMNNVNPTPKVGKFEATNPCGEQWLLPYESCNLGSIDVGKITGWDGNLDEGLLESTVRSATRFLDNVIDRNNYPLKEIEDITRANRKIGLGVMGFHHMLIKKGVVYGSDKSFEEAEHVMKKINEVSKDESRILAEERGPFPNFGESVYSEGPLIRNATTTTIAPTGTIGAIASTSQGIEPIFKPVQLRNVKDTIGEVLVETDRIFKEYLIRNDIYDEDVLRQMQEDGLEIKDLMLPRRIKEEMTRLFIDANNVSWKGHLGVQAAFQKHVDNAISKTINMSNDATKEDIADAYLKAYDMGCKGLTVYRDGSRDTQLLTGVGGNRDEGGLVDLMGKRPEVVGTTVKQSTPLGDGNNAFVTLNSLSHDSSVPYESFISIGKAGKDISAISEGYGRLTSRLFKMGADIYDVAGDLIGIGGETQNGFGKNKVTSVPDAIGKGLIKAYEQLNKKGEDDNQKSESGNIKKIEKNNGESSGNLCPDCSSSLKFEEGCENCSCGYSKCA